MKYVNEAFDMEKDLGYRRVQMTGRGSYIISLPKNWVDEIGMEKGSEIAFRMLDDSSLILVPRKIAEGKKEQEKPGLKEYWVYVDPRDDPRTVSRKIISLYVISADIVHVHFRNDGMVPKFRSTVNALVKNMLGSEIINETPREITIQILINHPEFPVEKAIRRMAVLAISANKDAVSALSNMSDQTFGEIADLCGDVDRLDLYVVRQLKFGLEQDLFEELGFRTPKEFLGYRIVANDIKGVADNAANIARNLMNLKKMIESQTLLLNEAVDEEVYSQILEYNSLAHKLFEDSLNAMFKRDYEQADKIISEIESFAAEENDLLIVVSSKKLDPNVASALGLLLDNSRRMMEYTRNISEVTLNRTIEEVSVQIL